MSPRFNPQNKSIFPSMQFLFPLLLMIVIIWCVTLYTDLASNRGLLSIRTIILYSRYIALSLIPVAIIQSFFSKYRVIALRSLFLSCLMAVFLFSEVFLADTIWADWTDKSREQGDKIVQSLNQYFEDEGQYPDALIDLVPDFLESIPRIEFGHRLEGFQYISSEDTFTLSFQAGKLTFCQYQAEPGSGSWQCGEP